MRALDLFSGGAGGWSLGLHRAGGSTLAACEADPIRRAVYARNFPGVLIYDDVRTLSAARILSDLGTLPEIILGSPPCQDISSANPRGRGVDGARSGLYFEALRLVGEVRPRWCAFENSANLRTRGADRILGALEALGYAAWPLVVAAEHFGAPHERKRSIVVGFREDSDPDEARRPDGPMEPSLRAPEFALARRPAGSAPCPHAHENGEPPEPCDAEMAQREGAGEGIGGPWRDWNGGFADHLRMADGLPAWLGSARIAGGGRRRSAARLTTEIYGDAICPQVAEGVIRAIMTTDAQMEPEHA